MSFDTSPSAETSQPQSTPKLLAISDIHVKFRGNEVLIDKIVSDNPSDWLIVAGDVSEKVDDVITTLEVLKKRFAKIIWVPGNHELYTPRTDPHQLFGVERYDYLVSQLRDRGIITPEDAYPLFPVGDTAYRIVPMFLLYDYSFRPTGWEDLSVLQALATAREANVVATDEFLLSPEPYATRDAWCRARLQSTRSRLDAISSDEQTILINHWPLRPEPCNILFDPEFSLWCGTMETYDWHTKYRAAACVYGHLHVPRTTWYDGVRFEEVSVGYPREWNGRGFPIPFLREILPDPQVKSFDLDEWGLRFKVDPERAQLVKEQHDKRRRAARERNDKA